MIAYCCNKLVSKSSFRYSALYGDQRMENKILCIGNSRGVNSFYSPYINEKYAAAAWNLSYNGLKMPMVKLFLDDYLEQHKSPELIFIEVSNLFDDSSEKGFSEFKMFSRNSKTLKEKIEETDSKTHWIGKLFPLYNFNSELLYRVLYYVRKSSDQNWINRHSISEALISETTELETISLKIDESNLALLKNLVQDLQERNIKVKLFLAPYLPAYRAKLNNVTDQLNLIEQSTNLLVLDLSEMLTDVTYFADRVHTNEKGAKLIADKLME